MKMKINYKTLAGAIAFPLAVGGLAALLTMSSMQKFAALNQPPLSPPGWLFPVVWSLLYILMGIASYLVIRSDVSMDEKSNGLKLYVAQLGVNFLWSILFFCFGLYSFSFVWLLLLLALVVFTAYSFFKIDRRAAYLLLPYIAWILFAGYLNLGIAILN